MTDTDARVPAGWYPDPIGLPQLRWWDNQAWTEHTSEARQPMVAQETIVQPTRLGFADDFPQYADPVADAPAGDRDVPPRTPPAAETLLEIEAPSWNALIGSDAPAEPGNAEPDIATFPAPDPSAPEIDYSARPAATARATASGRYDDLLAGDRPFTLPAWDEPRLGDATAGDTTSVGAPAVPFTMPASFVSASGATVPVASVATGQAVTDRDDRHADPRRARTMTVQSWIIALSPLTFIVISLFLLTAGGLDVSGATVVALSLTLPYLACIPLAFGDWLVCSRRGLRPPHWLWVMCLPPVYLAIRAVVLTRRTGRGFGPLLGLISSFLGVFGALILIPGILIGVNPLGFSHSIERSVEDQAAAFGVKLSVTCPPNPPTVLGDSFTCLAYERGDAIDGFDVRVSLQRANGWIDWHVDDWGRLTVTHTSMKSSN